MGAKYLEVVKRGSHPNNGWSPDEIRVWRMPTRMTLQLAHQSITRPYGVIEDVLIRVKQMVFPADFVVMDVD